MCDFFKDPVLSLSVVTVGLKSSFCVAMKRFFRFSGINLVEKTFDDYYQILKRCSLILNYYVEII